MIGMNCYTNVSTVYMNYEKKLLRYKDGYAVYEIKKYCIKKILAMVQKSVQYSKTELIKIYCCDTKMGMQY